MQILKYNGMMTLYYPPEIHIQWKTNTTKDIWMRNFRPCLLGYSLHWPYTSPPIQIPELLYCLFFWIIDQYLCVPEILWEVQVLNMSGTSRQWSISILHHIFRYRYPLVFKHGRLENLRTEWRFLARNITDFNDPFSSTPCLMKISELNGSF